MVKRRKITQEEYVNAIYVFGMYKAPRCWDTVVKAKRQYNKLTSESAKLAAVKEQIQIRFLDLGWKHAHHAWSGRGVTYRASKLFKLLSRLRLNLTSQRNRP